MMRLFIIIGALNGLASFLVWLIWFLDMSRVDLLELSLRGLSLLFGSNWLALQDWFFFWSKYLETIKNISLHYKFLAFLIFLFILKSITLFRFKTNFINDF